MVEPETLRQNIAQLNVISPIGAEVMDQVRGMHDGESVMRSDESSKLQEASEELGMSVAHRPDKKSLGDRSVRQGRGTNFEAVSRLSEYLDKLPNMPREAELKALVDLLEQYRENMEGRGGGSRPTKEDILAALQQFDGDVTHQFAALDIVREYFESAGAGEEFHALLAEVAQEFERTDVARDVRAGFAIAEIAARAAETLETDPASVREAYCEMLRGSRSSGQARRPAARISDSADRAFDPMAWRSARIADPGVFALPLQNRAISPPDAVMRELLLVASRSIPR